MNYFSFNHNLIWFRFWKFIEHAYLLLEANIIFKQFISDGFNIVSLKDDLSAIVVRAQKDAINFWSKEN